MNLYLSTYRQDFLWPNLRTFSICNPPKCSVQVQEERIPYQNIRCICDKDISGSITPQEYTGLPDALQCECSRLRRVAPRLDPNLYPVKMGPAPDFGLPNTSLKKLNAKNPYLYNVIRNTTPMDVIGRVNEDSLRTTNQAYHSRKDNEYPVKTGAEYIRLKGVSCPSEKATVLGCRSHATPSISCFLIDSEKSGNQATNDFNKTDVFRDATHDRDNFCGLPGCGDNSTTNSRKISHGSRLTNLEIIRRANKTDLGFADKSKGKSKRKGKTTDKDTAHITLPAWKSEYNEIIGQTGYNIIKNKIHQPHKLSKKRNFTERAIMRCHM